MYARLQSTQAPLPRNEDNAESATLITATISAHPGFRELYLMKQIGWGRGTMLSLWATQADADNASARTADFRGPRPFALDADAVYQVVDHWSGSGADQAPAAASIVHFDGPVSDARLDAARRAVRERIQPVLTCVPGIIRTMTLWQPDERSLAEVAFAISIDALDDASRAVNATSLLAGEDPALLTGPDRVVPYHVIGASTAAERPRQSTGRAGPR